MLSFQFRGLKVEGGNKSDDLEDCNIKSAFVDHNLVVVYYRRISFSDKRGMWHVHKFGGTSVSNYVQVGNIVLQQKLENKEKRLAVVVSAMSGITDALIQTVETAKLRDDKYLEKIQEIVERHYCIIDEVLKLDTLKEQVRKSVDADASNLRDILRSVYLLANYSTNTLEVISGYGELWSAQILAAHLQERSETAESGLVTWLDSRQVLFVESRVDSHHGTAPVVVDVETSSSKLNNWLANVRAIEFPPLGYY